MLFAALLPAGAVAAERHDLLGPDARPEFLPGRTLSPRAGARRRAEFVTGRACAAEALARLGAGSTSVGRALDRSPRWPAGVTGSITHCDGLVAAVVGWRDQLGVLGIDATPLRPLPPALAAAAERDELARAHATLAGVGIVEVTPAVAGAVLWSCREAAYKVWHPVTGRVVGDRDIHVELDAGGTFLAKFTAGVMPPPRLRQGVRGRWATEGGLAIALMQARPTWIRARGGSCPGMERRTGNR